MEDIRAWLFTMLAWNVHGGVAEKLSDPSITSMLYGADIVVVSETSWGSFCVCEVRP